MLNLKRTMIGTLLLVSCLVTAANAEFYKWVDENGVTHYSEFPPSDTKLDQEYQTYEGKDGTDAKPSTDNEARQKPPQDIDKKAVNNKKIVLRRADIVGRWVHLGVAKTRSSDKLSKPYKPQSWEFKSSGTVTYRIGKRKNSFPYKVEGSLIVTEPFKKQYRNFEVVAVKAGKMIWKDPIFETFIHVRRGY